MSAHTPGPLRVAVNRADTFLSVHGADCLIYAVCRVSQETWDRQKADAYLFAAAPELARYLQSGADQLEEWAEDLEGVGISPSTIAGMRAVASDYRALLAKIDASGETK